MGYGFFKGNGVGSKPSLAVLIGLNDYAEGDGTEQDFTLVNKTFTSLNNTTQLGGGGFPRKSTLGVTGSGSTVHLSEPPGVDVPIVFPPISVGSLFAYDHPVTGIPDSQIKEGIFFVGDLSDIDTQSYQGYPADSDMLKIYFTNRTPEEGADPEWLQLAPLDAATMEIGTYEAAGEPLFLEDPIKAAGTLNDDYIATDTVIEVVGVDFIAGQFILIDKEAGDDFDVAWVIDAEDMTTHWELTLLDGLQHAHLTGATVYACVAGFAAKVTIPDDVGGGFPLSLFNTSLDADFIAIPR